MANVKCYVNLSWLMLKKDPRYYEQATVAVDISFDIWTALVLYYEVANVSLCVTKNLIHDVGLNITSSKHQLYR